MEKLPSLIEAVQDDLPLAPRPFAALGARCGLCEAEVIDKLGRLNDEGVLREISAILDGKRLGFQSSLVAARIPAERLEKVTQRINSHPGVSHNYERDHEYNVWFTLAVAGHTDFSAAVRSLFGDDVSANDVLELPALATYKLRVRLSPHGGATSRESHSSAAASSEGVLNHLRWRPSGSANPVTLSEGERRLLSVLERPLPIVPDLWRHIADCAEWDEDAVMQSIDRWKRSGLIRRVSGVLRHRRLGFTANGMSCFGVPVDRIDDAGAEVSRFDFVSHCYYRDAGGRWKLPLFAMIHAESREQCLDRARRIASEIEADAHEVLFSLREFKKERVRYFTGEEP